MLSKLAPLVVAAASAGLVAYGVSEPTKPAHAEPAAVARPGEPASVELPAPVTAPEQALTRPITRMQVATPPVVMGQYTIPYTIHLTITAVSNPNLNYLVGLTAPLDWVATGAWAGNVQLPQGGITFIFGFLYAQPTNDNLPWCDVVACNGGRDALGQFAPSKGILAVRDYRKASNMAPIQIVGRMQGGSNLGGLTTVDYVISP
jgi:hypothetical protein